MNESCHTCEQIDSNSCKTSLHQTYFQNSRIQVRQCCRIQNFSATSEKFWKLQFVIHERCINHKRSPDEVCCRVLQCVAASRTLDVCIQSPDEVCCSVLQCHELLMYTSEVPMVTIPLCTSCWKFYLHEKVELLKVLPILQSRVCDISKKNHSAQV